MSVWNKLGDLGKGLGDWGKDVGLMAVSGPKFFWDVATAPWNDRKEFNGFFNTITNATIDANKNVLRPFGGVLAAVAATNKNILREPLAAALSLPDEFSLSEGLVNPMRRKKNQEQWKKAWDNRQEVSFGKGLAPTQPQNIILKGISSITNNEDFLPQYLKSDFDIYDKTQRDKAFKSSIYGAITSNVGDVGAQLGLDVTLGASKLIKAGTAADDSFTAIKGINAAHAGEANKYSKMAEDFAANTDLWALNHPWVKKSNDISTTSHLLGAASTKEEALYTMSALLGDSGAVAKLDILKRPDIAEPIKIASGELTRRGLKTFLRDEAKIATTIQEGMLNLGLLRTPEEIAIDTEFLKAYATHDKYISRLMGIATPGSAPLTQGVGLNITQKIGAELATARTVPFHSLEVGMPSVETYQPTPFHRMYHILSWAERERPNGLMNLNEGESIKEVTTTADRIVKKGLSDYPTMGAAISKYAAAATPEAKKLAAQEFEAIGFRGLAKKYDLSVDQIETILTNHRLVKDGFLKEAKEQGYVYDAVTDTNLKSAFFESQTSNFYALADFDHIDNVIRSTRGALKYAWESKDKITNTLESVNDLWKASVLLRLGYPVRNGIDSQLRIAAAVGSMAVLKHLGPGANNLIYNTNQEAIRLIDKVKNASGGIKTLSYEATQLQMQNLGKEIAGHELTIAQLNKTLNKNPNDIDAISRLVAEQLKLDTKKIAFDSNNASLTKIEQAKVASKKRGIGQGEMLLPSTFDTADGFTYGFADGFAGSTGELFQSLNSADKIFSRILDDWSNIYKTKTIKGSRGSVTPDKANYYTEWSKAINEALGNSAVVRKLLDDKSKIEDVVKWLKDDPKGILLRQRLNLSANESEEYVYQASSFLNSHMPKGTGIREAFLDGKVNESFLRNAIKDPAKLPIVNGFLIEDSLGNISNLNLKSVINTAFKFLGSRPENAWARNPLFIELYTRSAEKRLALAEGLNKGRFTQEEFQGIQRDIEMGARKDALKGVNQILYNVERRSNLAESLRFISPFLSAQENALKTWLKLGGKNINIFNRAAILWNAPNSAGFVTDQNGDIVPPYKSYNPDDTMWFQVPESMKRLPIIGKGLESLDKVGISKRTMDVVFMGSPYSLSVGPYFGVVAANIIKFQPSTSAVLSWAFPYGPDDSFKQFLPTFLRRQLERAQGLDNTTYANTFGLIWQTEMHKARDEKRPYPTEKEIKAKADAFYNMRTFAALILPVAPQFDSPYKLYIDKYRIYMEKYGIQAQSKFFEDYPEFFDFAISFSENKTKVAPTMTAVENSRRYASLIAKVKDDNPALIGMIVNGSSTSKFNPTAYWLQQGTSISPASKEKFRGSQTPLEAAKSNEAKEGWIRFRKIQDFIDVQLTARGLNSTTQKGAEDLARLKTAIITVLSTKQDPVTGKSTGEVSAWFEDYNDVNRVKVLKTVSGLKKTIADTKFMEDNKNNPTWKSVVVYMKIRDMLALRLGARESANIDAKSNSDIRFLYDVIVKKLKSDDIGFSDMYDRYLSQDTVYNKYLGAANG
jgi:hypothetical protein